MGRCHFSAISSKTPSASTRFSTEASLLNLKRLSAYGAPPSATTSKYWGVHWSKNARRWQAKYNDATGKPRYIGLYDTQEAAAHAVNAAIRRAGLEGRRKTNPVVDGQLVPKPPGAHNRKRRRDEPAAAPSPRTRRR